MKRLSVILLTLIAINCCGQNQGISNFWQSGYISWAGLPYGGNDVNFFSGSPVISYKSRLMNFSDIVANISDTLGNLLFYTNGVWIADSTDNIMQNGNNISPPFLNDTLGLWVWQACLILPFPNHPNQYYLIHSSIDGLSSYYYTKYLRFSIIDMSLHNGLGAVTSKNNIILTDTINSGMITACKHGNGRDWWITCLDRFSDVIYTMLLTPYGISGPFLQHIGTIRDKGVFQSVFSPDGSKFAFICGGKNPWPAVPVQLLDFDRCSGLFSNPVNLNVLDTLGQGSGIAFSPNSQFLYTSYNYNTYQFDITQPNIVSTQTTIAQWDSTYSPTPPFSTLFDKMLLAPDGKIYLSTGNSTLFMHVINNPDSAGLACDLVQHAIALPAYSVSGPPNHPNYFLGAAPGNPCNNTSVNPGPSSNEKGVTANPNPTDGKFTLWFPVNKDVGWLEIYNTDGMLLHKEPVAQWSQYKYVDLGSLTPKGGMFFCKMRWKDGEGSVKVVKE